MGVVGNMAWLSAGLACSVWLSGGRARACDYPQDGVHVSDTSANGVVVVRTYCHEVGCLGEVDADDIRLVEPGSDTLIEGKLYIDGDVQRSALLGFKPTVPLEAGRTYELRWPGLRDNIIADSTLVFTALPQNTRSAGDLPFDATVERDEDWGQDVLTCESWYLDSCGSRSMNVQRSRRSFVRLLVKHGMGYREEDFGQYLVAIAFHHGDTGNVALDAPTFRPAGYYRHAFYASAPQYCYSMELHSLIDGSVRRDEACFPHADLGELGVTPLSPDEILGQAIECDEPMPGLELEWCQLAESMCMGGSLTDTICGRVTSLCTLVRQDNGLPPYNPNAATPPGGTTNLEPTSPPPSPTAGMGAGEGESDGRSMPSMDGPGTQETAQAEDPPGDGARHATYCGCRLVGAGRTPGVLALGLLGSSLLLAGQRRRRRRIRNMSNAQLSSSSMVTRRK